VRRSEAAADPSPQQGFILAQILGGFVGAALVYANYSHAIDIFEGGAGVRTMKTAGVFGAYAVRPLTQCSAVDQPY
jgi:aquaglyceroporin related protein